jgi:hypothetical protein
MHVRLSNAHSIAERDRHLSFRMFLAWLFYVVAGVWGFVYLSRTLKADLRLFTIVCPVMLINVVAVSIWSSICANAKVKWAWMVIPFGCCLLIYASIVKETGNFAQATKGAFHSQYGWQIALLLAILCLWILTAPIKGWTEVSPQKRRLATAMAAIGTLAMVLFVGQFLYQSLSTRSLSLDEVRGAMSWLLRASVVLYVLLGGKMLLPKTIA